MWLIRAIVRLRKQALSALPVHQCLSGCLVLGPAFGSPLWPSVIEPWAKSCEKKVSTLYSLGATFKLRPHSWFLLDKHLQPCIWLTSGSWIEFLSRPWTCLLSMDISGVLDSCMTPVITTRAHCSWHGLQKHPMTDLSTSFTPPAESQTICWVGPRWCWRYLNRWHPTALILPPSLPQQTVFEPPGRLLC